MLSVDDNKLITQVGPGAPMGEVFRRYWIPALMSSEVPSPDCPPVKVRLRAKDVIHSFFLPNLRVKQDAVPGLTVEVWFTGPSFELLANNNSVPAQVWIIEGLPPRKRPASESCKQQRSGAEALLAG